VKRLRLQYLTLMTVALVAACGQDAQDRPSARDVKPTSTIASKAGGEAPAMDALMALDKRANEAYARADSTVFEELLSEKFVMREGGQRFDKAAAVKMIAGARCEVRAWNLDEPWMARIDADTYVLSYRGTWDGSCRGPDGKSTKIPSPTRAATIWIRSGDRWQAAFHGENPIIDPKNSPEPKPAPPARPAEDAAATPADPNTSALVAVEVSVWEAWKAHDARKLEGLTAESLSFIDIFGNSYSNKTDTIEAWSGGLCEIKTVEVSEGIAAALSPTVTLLMHTGTTDGTCYGANVPAVHGNSVYVKEGDAWKLAFTMNRFAM
jgi:hypothetical protein